MEVLSFDENGNLAHFGRCEIAINIPTKHLIVKQNEATIIEATFEGDYFHLKNMLFVFCSNEKNIISAFAIIFSSEESGYKVFEKIQTSKSSTSSPSKSSNHDFNALLEKKIFLPFVAALPKINSFETKYKNVFITLLEWFPNEQKQRCLNILKTKCEKLYNEIAENFVEFIMSDEVLPNQNVIKNLRKRKLSEDPFEEKEDSDDEFQLSDGEIDTEESDSERSENVNEFESSEDDNNSGPPAKRSRPSFINGQIIEAPNYELLKFEWDNKIMYRLFIFPNSDDREFCYDYACTTTDLKYFLCHGCRKMNNKTVTAVLRKHSNGGKEYIQLSKEKHICELIKYEPEKYRFDPSKQIVKSPNFKTLTFDKNGTLRKRLFIFIDSQQQFCYEYAWLTGSNGYVCRGCYRAMQKKIYTSKLNSINHSCNLVKYDPDKYIFDESKLIVEASNFEALEFEQDGETKGRLFIFSNSSDRKLCYEYYWSERAKFYKCCGCHQKSKQVTAKLDKEKNIVKLNKTEHVCDMREYNPDKYILDESKQIVKPPNFKVINYNQDGIDRRSLFIFTQFDLNLGYGYHWSNSYKHFDCSACKHKNHSCTAKICQNFDGKEYIKLNIAEHVCQEKEYQPEKYKDHIILYKPDYQLVEQTVYGITKKRLLTIVPENRDLCYEFIKSTNFESYICGKCLNKGNSLRAHICIDSKGNEYISLQDRQHICAPVPYALENYETNKIIRKPNYQLLKRKWGGKLVQKLIIFIDETKELCYEYSFNSDKKYHNYFYCWVCQKQKKISVYAKLVQNENNEEYVELSKHQHECEPIKFKPENLNIKIVKQPNYKLEEYQINFNGERSTRLVIFDEHDKTKCYFYGYKNDKKLYTCIECSRRKSKYVTAKMVKDENGEDCLRLNDTEHVCKPSKYEPPVTAFKTVHAPGFKIKKSVFGGKETKFLIITNSENKKTFYKYYYVSKLGYYACSGCKSKNKQVTAKIQKKEDGEEFVELGPTEHICKPLSV